MEPTFTEGQTVVSSDDHTIGKVVGHRNDCVLVETGHVFKTTHAIPSSFLHEHDGQLRATVAKEIVHESPQVDSDNFDCDAVLLHYGLGGPYEVDPDPTLDNAETEGARHGVDPSPEQRVGTLGETDSQLPPDGPDNARLEVFTDSETAPLSPYGR
ncbi:MAG TPA: hypothetical protein VGU02_14105 [Gaiellaceae bacterium]|nr:hypothetical protein [Gaiellaceae bacterium]